MESGGQWDGRAGEGELFRLLYHRNKRKQEAETRTQMVRREKGGGRMLLKKCEKSRGTRGREDVKQPSRRIDLEGAAASMYARVPRIK